MHFPFVEKRQIAQFNKVVGIFPEGKSCTTSEARAQSHVSSTASSTYSYDTANRTEFPVLTLNNTWVKSASTIWFNKAVSLLCIL